VEKPPHFAFAVAVAFDVVCFSHPPTNIVISTEAVHSLIVNRAVERPPHFAFTLTHPKTLSS
jgi:hypothetical protein